MRRKLAFHALLVFSLVNVLIFIFRDHFVYKPYADHASLYSSCDPSCTMKWKQFISDYPMDEFAETRSLTNRIIDTATSTKSKILQIGRFLIQNFSKQEGDPTNALLRATPLQQYRMLSANNSVKLWCGNYAQMFSWFCWSQGITTRSVEFMIPGDRHVVNECYLPESGRWVLVDLTNNLLFVEDSSYPGGLHLQRFREAESSPMMAWRISGDSILNTPLNNREAFISRYYRKDVPFYYYHRINNEKVYSAGNKLASYVLPVSWYEILDMKKESNLLFYLKEIFLFLWIIAFFVFLAGRLKKTS